MACAGTCSSSTPGGDAANFDGQLKEYYSGSPGSETFDVGSGCTEQRAMEAGSAVTAVGADKKCRRVQGIRIIIGDTAESVDSGFQLVNKNLSTSGTQVAMSSNFNLNAPAVG